MVLNVNFPSVEPDQVAGIEVTVQGVREESGLHFDKRTDLRGRDYYWLGYRGKSIDPPAGTDLHAVREARISVTPLLIDLTHLASVHDMKGQLGGPAPKFDGRRFDGPRSDEPKLAPSKLAPEGA